MVNQYYLERAKQILDNTLDIEVENGLITIRKARLIDILGTALEEQAKELY